MFFATPRLTAMQFVFFDTLTGLAVDLAILKRDTQRNHILLFQHEGTLDGDNKRIGNQHDARPRFTSFLTLAKEKNVALALTPEYSCPLFNIEEVLADENKWPAAGNIWALGAESMNKQALATFNDTWNKGNIAVFYETEPLNQNMVYVDPLFYIFRSKREGADILVVIIQFKTMHMGVWNEGILERDNLIQGNIIYILRNSVASIQLITLICSEAMNFAAALTHEVRETIHWEDLPYLVLNPMINPEPAHPHFAAFRKSIFYSNNKEIIELNWNRHSKIGHKDLLTYKSSRSAVFIKSTEIDDKDIKRIRKNHKLGLYYFFLGTGKYAFIFNSHPHIFLIATPPVSIVEGLPVQSRREGPLVMEVYNMDDAGELEKKTEVSDNHIEYLSGLKCGNAFITRPEGCVIDKERLACLTACEMPKKTDIQWFQLTNLRSIRIDDVAEINRRFTIAEDSNPDSVLQRKSYIGAINALNNKILPNKDSYPPSIADLKAYEILLGYCQQVNADGKRLAELDSFKYNVTTADDMRISATICYLDSPDDGELEEKYDSLQALFDHEINNRGRVVIFYERGGEVIAKWDNTAGNILNTNDFTGPSILKEQ